MKYGIVSDLHLEFYSIYDADVLLDLINKCEADKIIIAGDTHPDKTVRDEFFSKINKPSFVIMGNHDYYGGDWFDDMHIDDNIVGGCLWTDFRNDPLVEMESKRFIADFRQIKNWDTKIVKAVNEIHETMIFAADECDIVVTHFPPSEQSISPEFAGDILNQYFTNDLDDKILESNKKLWVHGHVHSRWDYMIGGCRVVANPLGYPREIKQPFSVKVVEI